MLDTGSYLYLLGSASVMQQLQTGHRATAVFGDVGGLHPFAHTALGKVHMTISGQPMEIYFSVLTDSTMPSPLTLGAGALRDMDFLLDFRRQHLCFDLHPGLR